jgi:glutamate-1-semialdehyde aminotransferase/acyl carrier protein
LLEVGPRLTATTLARQQATNLKQQVAIASLSTTAQDEGEWLALMQAVGQLWLAGVEIDSAAFYADEYRHRLPLPTYPFERQRYWIDAKPFVAEAAPSAELISSATAPVTQSSSMAIVPPASPPVPLQPESSPSNPSPLQTSQSKVLTDMPDTRKQRLMPILKDVLETTSGLDFASADPTTTFLEMGLDSLSLTQVALALKKRFKVKVAFRNLLEDYPNLDLLAGFLDQSLPADAFPADATPEPAAVSSPIPVSTAPVAATLTNAQIPPPASGDAAPNGWTMPQIMPQTMPQMMPQMMSQMMSPNHGAIATHMTPTNAIEALVAQQLQLMAQQLQLLSKSNSGTIPTDSFANAPVPANPATPPAVAPPAPTDAISHTQPSNGAAAPIANAPASEVKAPPSRGPGAKIEKSNHNVLTPEQEIALARIIARYVARTQESKRQTQEHRRYLADPRTVSGFSPLLKEMVYPIVTDRASGSKLWDVDGNEYVDLTNGFGLNFFGWSPDFVTEAIKAQLDKGIEIGPQTPLAGRVAKLVSELTGMERVAFCNTGSEAVMATLRLARTVTGRNLVATFNGDYHGTFDEVLYRPGANLRTLPAAPGILPSMFENLLVLDYGTPESLEILRNRADDLAAILVEPVRSRDPGCQPKEFLQEIRRITEQSETAFIFDEVVTGFRVHPGGAQAYFGIQADLATYGKVVGGGIPIGIVAGKAEYMDALDGGFWQYGDNSIPEVGVTFFAGTFVRHPMAMAAAEAVLLKLQDSGPELQRSLAEKVNKFATHLNQHFEWVGAPIRINHFTSFFYIDYPTDLLHAQLLFYLLREKGVHVWDHRPCFFTLSHSSEDIEWITRAFKDSVAELQAMGFLPGKSSANTVTNGHGNGQGKSTRNVPPQPGARLGKDPEGNPAWFIPDPERPGKYLQIGGGA